MNNSSIQPRIAGISTVVPSYDIEQDFAIEAAKKWLSTGGNPELSVARTVQIFQNAGVERRHGVVPVEEMLKEKDFPERNALYGKYARILGEKALKSVFEKTRIKPYEIDLFITVSCTGFMIPALDAYLMNRFPFKNNVRRLPVTELGCAAGVSSLIMGGDYIRAYPDANVLILTLELCTLNMQPTDKSTDHIISTAIFGDGAAAAIVTGGKAESGLHMIKTENRFFPGTIEFMGYDVERTGFHIFLSRRISKFIEDNIASQMESMLGASGLDIEDIDTWLFHPGGSRILKSIENGLGIDGSKLRESACVLRDYGNMSSATIFFIIDSYVRNETNRSGSYQVVGAVGPGFGLDTILTQWK
jgi:alkylresorcinol/alkylpyrone synthase